MRDTLICTVGTSLITNLRRDTALHHYLESQNTKALVTFLLETSPDDRICGAEINSIHSILKGKHLKKAGTLIFLISDTEDGKFTGQILRQYYMNSKNPDRFAEVDIRIVGGLTADDPNLFRNTGLRNLVRRISEVVKAPEESKRILINATGGYKAQISFAGMIGQALDIPVCYMYEGFPDVIELPPQPISLDLSFWLEYNDLFYDLEEGMQTDRSFAVPDPRFDSLVDDVSEKGTYFTTLSPSGQLFHETFRHHFAKQTGLLPPSSLIAPEKKKIRYEDANLGKHKGLDVFLKKLRFVPYVNEIYTHYYNPDLNEPVRFRKSAKGETGQVEGIFSNAGATTKFSILTTAKTKRQTDACIADLNDRYARGEF